MQIVKTEAVSDKTAWVDPIVVNNDTVIVNVLLGGSKTKRVFRKKESYWYSELQKKRISFTKGVNVGESTEVVYGYSGDDIFFIFDLEEYKIGKGSFLGYMEIFGNE